LIENIPRVLPPGLAVRLQLDRVPVLPVFKWLAATGNVDEKEMLRTFNCGIGMVAVLDPQKADAAIASLTTHGEKVVPLGDVIAAKAGGAVAFTGHLDLLWPPR
jgi:phosphoribosylformylglycinamidine cyclo-ligase